MLEACFALFRGALPSITKLCLSQQGLRRILRRWSHPWFSEYRPMNWKKVIIVAASFFSGDLGSDGRDHFT